ncbi:hypothetical protein IJ750_07550 [bacterium]|nr:hypothetical protein [bacterium]
MVTDLCIIIPTELKQYKIGEEIQEQDIKTSCAKNNVLIKRNDNGLVEQVEYFDENGELEKSLTYKGASVSKETVYKNGKIRVEKEFSENKLTSKKVFRNNGETLYENNYRYDSNNLVFISKKEKDIECAVIYIYDELDRIISRKIYKNREIISEQFYKYDISGKILGYRDRNQTVEVCRRNQKNELLCYKIKDIKGNEILIKNIFDGFAYLKTEIVLNGNCATVMNRDYVDNIVLKKPCATDDDLDLVISKLENKKISETECKKINDISEHVIKEEIEKVILPIALRKRAILNSVEKSA